ncbi:hypothetical protein [Natrinema sp. H-ect4]|uniref:hypothetical protein n=1 Tax=Natrinema sp. H-ect4 TaxID=3242699 RepID=UPI0035A96E19
MEWILMTVKAVTLTPVDRIPCDSRIHHYDELCESAKNHLPRLLRTDEMTVLVPDTVGAALEPYDIVKFTGYYRITVDEEPSSVRVSS